MIERGGVKKLGRRVLYTRLYKVPAYLQGKEIGCDGGTILPGSGEEDHAPTLEVTTRLPPVAK